MSDDFQDYPVNEDHSVVRQAMRIETIEQFTPHSVAFAALEDEDGDYLIDKAHLDYPKNLEVLNRWCTRVLVAKEGGDEGELPTERRLKVVVGEAMQGCQSRFNEERGDYAHAVLPCHTDSGQPLFKWVLVYDGQSGINPIQKHYDWLVKDSAANGL